MYSVVTSMTREPASASRARQKAAEAETPDRLLLVESIARVGLSRNRHARHVKSQGQIFRARFLRLLHEIKRGGGGGTQQPMGIIHRAHERFLLIAAAMIPDRTCGQQLLIERVAAFKAFGRHAGRGAHGICRRLRKWDVERAILASQKPGGGECLQLFALGVVIALADVDERRHGIVQRPARPQMTAPMCGAATLCGGA